MPGDLFDSINHLVELHAGAVWVIPLVFALAALDGFFPPLPSEAVLISLAAASATTGQPAWLPLGFAAAVGAVAGDNVAYELGRRGRLDRLAGRSRRLASALAWAGRQLDRRGTVIIVVGRYVPIGRIAVNLTAGAARYPRARFAGLTVVAGATWATYSVGVGHVAGTWVEDNPALGALCGIAFALVLGVAVERLAATVLPATRAIPAGNSGETVARHDEAMPTSGPLGEVGGALRVVRDDLSDPAVVDLLSSHAAQLRAVSPPESAHVLDVEALRHPDVTIWVARDDDGVLGVGALKRLGRRSGEVKSMRTAPHATRRGVASAILRTILDEARTLGLTRVSLETGSAEFFAPARRLYARHGFTECEPFGSYRPDPESTFMTLRLT
ncbi:GNAT family N-acetyltransferase [Intrasporangium sp.]|uniref:GNAT family N-acetyltransferase n=1 Tax=Intrasporangium sp. TaxID=1925024 RepID=UPI00293BB065|nr:GNAT family N-acetyltransferase [Intrasporangium sp.]